ncbi:phage tail-collar fiber domain-containing protein [Enterobacter asburiae]|uniref:phage tail-collar fiber domain-containing protein n=1 Tax=Enterobacter asburiae TaxID=61645 RepID=UPI0009313E18|nr:phage tail protein [Enterobacter asburiae]
MAQTVITKAFTEWKAQQAIDSQPVNLDEFIFAYIPDLDVTKPVENTEGLPPADKIVHRQAVSKSGVVNANSVVYSVTLGADVGDFNFNWIGLANKATGTLAMIIHAPTQSKIKNASGQQGNVLVRSMLMEYSGAESATNITTPAETWQIDFTARLAAMDERLRLENIDLYGAAAFFGDGYLVSKTGSQFFVTKGAGYVAGLRSELSANQNITVSTKPVKVWLDVAWSGTLTSEWMVQSKIIVRDNLTDYVENGNQHYVFAVASINASGDITDLRPKGTLNDQAFNDALKRHEQSRNHPDATTTEKGFTKLSSATDSDSETEAATPKAVKAANDNANGRVPSGRKVNGHALTEDIIITSQDIFSEQAVAIGNAIDLNTLTKAGLYYQGADAQAASGKNYPEAAAGSLEIYKHAGLTQVYRVYYNSTTYIRTFYNGTWSGWIKRYDAANKPTPSDIGAVSASGGSYNSTFRFGSVGTVPNERNTASLVSAQGGAGSIVSGVAFEWYDNAMVLGLVRGDSYNTLGFALWLGNKNLFNISPSGNAGLAGNLVSDGSIYANYLQTSGDVRSERNISSKGIIEAGGGLFDTPGVRVYSPNNMPPQQDLSPYATTSWTIANFLQGGIRLASPGTADNGNNDNTFAYAPNGAVVTAVQQKTNYTAVQYRYVQYNIGGNWYTAWVA